MADELTDEQLWVLQNIAYAQYLGYSQVLFKIEGKKIATVDVTTKRNKLKGESALGADTDIKKFREGIDGKV